jgi:hypothetical protein
MLRDDLIICADDRHAKRPIIDTDTQTD